MDPSSILPYETFSAICVEFAFDIVQSERRAFTIWKSLTGVSRAWRSIARQTPDLWTVLCPVRHRRLSPTIHFAEQSVLARNRPLHVIWPDVPHAFEDSAPAVAALAEQLHHLQYTSTMRALSRQSLGTLPHVTTVDISMWEPASMDALRALRDTPALQSLTLTLVSEPDMWDRTLDPVSFFVPKVPHLTCLILHASAQLVFHAQTCMDLLSASKETLICVAVTGDIFWPLGMSPNAQITLELGALQVLTLSHTAARLMYAIRTPNAQDIEVRQVDWPTLGNAALATCLGSNSEALTYLHFTHVGAVASATVRDALAVLEPCTSVETLVLDFSEALPSKVRFGRLIMRALIDYDALPSLKNLYVWLGSRWRYEDIDLLHELQQKISPPNTRNVAIHSDQHCG